MNDVEHQEPRQDWRQEPWVGVVNKIVGIGFAAYGGQAIEDGGKGYVKGFV
jgi:hypothetical protein